MSEDSRWWSFSVNDSGEDAKRIFRVWAESAWRDKVSFEALLLPVSRCYLACFRLDDDGAKLTLDLGPLAFLTLRARSWRASARATMGCAASSQPGRSRADALPLVRLSVNSPASTTRSTWPCLVTTAE